MIAYPWGDIGHEDIVLIAARSLPTFLSAAEKNLGFDTFFESRRFALGYLANVPDTDWRDQDDMKYVAGVDLPSHYLNVENILGIPDESLANSDLIYSQKIRDLPKKYEELKKIYNGKPNALSKTPENRKEINVYYDLGTAPWRIKQLYDLLTESFRCIQSKNSNADKKSSFTHVKLSDVFQMTDGNKFEESFLKSYQCHSSKPVSLDYMASLVIAGVLSHFVQDIGMPYHISMNFDGWVTGNGGIHKYFETDVVSGLDEKVRYDTYKKLLDKKFKGEIFKKLKMETIGFLMEDAVVQLVLNLAADSYQVIKKIKMIDDQYAIQSQRSTILPWGVYPYEATKDTLRPAQRVPADHKKIQQAFRPLIIERYAISAWVIGKLWYQAWEKADRPRLPSSNELLLNFPHQPPYIWPSFDVDVLKNPRPGNY